MVDASTMTGRASLRALVADAMRSITMGVVMPLPFDDGPQAVTFEVEKAGQPPAAQDPEEEAGNAPDQPEPEDPRPED